MSEQLNKAIALVKEFNETHGVKMQGGKKYTMVKERIEAFRIVFGTDLGITTKVLHMDDMRVAVQCDITNVDGFVIASGIAEEERNASRITKTSALEVAQTSAAGRALAMLGLAGGEFASGDEIFNAQNTEKAQAKEAFKPAAQAAPKGPSMDLDTDARVDASIQFYENCDAQKFAAAEAKYQKLMNSPDLTEYQYNRLVEAHDKRKVELMV